MRKFKLFVTLTIASIPLFLLLHFNIAVISLYTQKGCQRFQLFC